MIGFIKKDFFTIKNNIKTIVIAIVIYVFYSVMFEMDMSFLLPFMALMIGLSTFNYDDLSNFHVFGSALPKGRENAVKSKYVTFIAFIIITAIISAICSYVIGSVKNTYNFENSISYLMGSLVAIICLLSILLPFMFKYGAEKGRIVMFILGIGIMGLYLLFTKVVTIDMQVIANIMKFIKTYAIPLFIGSNVLMIGISYFVSKKIYLKKEF